MSGNTFGKILKLTSFGESHGAAIGGVLEGFPAEFTVDFDALNQYISRRKPVDAAHSTSRREPDQVELLSGFVGNTTVGTPIGFLIRNLDSKSSDYEQLKDVYRPGHADFSWQQKYGIRDYRGGGRSSARETLSRVVAGGLALQFLQSVGIEIVASVVSLGEIQSIVPVLPPSRNDVDLHPLRCVDAIALRKMQQLIEKTKLEKDSLGGTIHCWIAGVSAGLGEPVFDKIQARLAGAMMSINAAKGFSYGLGFEASVLRGSQHNDSFVFNDATIKTAHNRAGGILGGISTGENINFTVAFKPIASIGLPQQTVDSHGNSIEIEISGRHDTTVLPRAIPIVESMAALTIMDFYLMQKINNQ